MEKEQIINPAEKILIDLVNETRPPMTPEEQELQDDIQKIKDKGRIVEIPGDFL